MTRANIEFETIKNFVANVELLLAESQLRQQGGNVELYFDTADVRGAALGMDAYYEGASFQSALFDHPRALVRALMARGTLGRFHLLGAHQAEFLLLMNEGFRLHEEDNLNRSASEFWKDAGVIMGTISPRTLSPGQVKESFLWQVGNAANLVKAVEAIRGSWRWRLKEWRRNKTFAISSELHHHIEHVTSDIFIAVKNRLDQRRPNSPNNLADALALVALVQKVDAFKQGHTLTLPCFYAATRLLVDIVRAVGCEEHLQVTLPSGGKPVSVLRSSDYFVLRSIFLAAEDSTTTTRQNVFTIDALRSLHSEFRDLLRLKHTLSVRQLGATTTVESTNWIVLIDKFRDLSFFDNIWLPCLAEKDTRTSLRRLLDEDDLASPDELQEGLQTAVAELRYEIQVHHDRTNVLHALCGGVPAAYLKLRKSLRLSTSAETDVMCSTGLLSFSFPQPSWTRILSAIASLLSSDQQLRKDALARIVQRYFHALDSFNTSDVQIAVAILWVADMDSEILTLLRARTHTHYSLDLVYTAAALRLGHEIDLALETYDALEHNIRSARTPAEQADIAMGLAYLYYHLWHRCAHENVLQCVRRKLRCERSDLILRAVRHARAAYDVLLKQSDELKMVYVLNQIVIFMSMSGIFQVADVQPFADRLRQYEGIGLWQCHFDDTLARYYLLWSRQTEDYNAQVDLLKMGLDRAKKARKQSPEDQQIVATSEIINDELLKIRGRHET